MSLLSDSDLASMRATLAESLPGTAVIQTNAFASDGGGGGTSTWSARGTAACRISALTGGEQIIGERIAENAKWVITFPAGTDVSTKDRVVVDSHSYEVLALHAPRSYEVSRRVEVEEVV